MKKNILKAIIFSFALCMTIVSEAQIEKGMKVLTGNVGFDNFNTKDLDSLSNSKYKRSSFRLSPTIGFFINDKVCIGLSVPLNYSSSSSNSLSDNSNITNKNEQKSHSFSYALSPYARYYKKITDKFYGFLSGSLNFGLTNSYIKYQYSSVYALTPVYNYYSNSEAKTLSYNYSANVSIGLTYFVSSKLALEASLAGLGYRGSKGKVKDKLYDNYQNQSGFYASIAPSNINLGLSYYFR